MALLHCELYSNSIRMDTSVNIILPQDKHPIKKQLKTLYLLHGRSQNYSAWTRYTRIEYYAEKYNVAIIMPEANRSFYTDMEYGVRYHQYLTQELPSLCESMFQISSLREDTYIAGYSMGGYGALKAALSHPNRYCGCAAFSSVTDIAQHLIELPEENPKKNEFRGIFGTQLQADEEDDLFLLAKNNVTLKHKPELFLTCGLEDHLYPENLKFYQYTSSLPYQIKFETWHGIHDWEFWDCSIQKALEYFFIKENNI
ncbi:alpha/beta hydrolase [Lachnoclostridium phytofermentans]|uniref:alpha/beta hydrolase n=1 Tax=Lachnoclostridium phytofermentans TaxID=66219 RepID=UPI000494F7DA|nr:alpha/beta hydrolase family protein [Lachnoclostridium phytofermentans]